MLKSEVVSVCLRESEGVRAGGGRNGERQEGKGAEEREEGKRENTHTVWGVVRRKENEQIYHMNIYRTHLVIVE